MVTQEIVLLAVENAIATITLNKPEKCNAIDNMMVQQLMTAFKQVRADKNASVVILQAHGEHFCAGADINWMQKIAANSLEENKQDARQLADLMNLIYVFPKPVIVLAQGSVFGGGLGLLSAADIAVVAQDANFTFSEVKLGISPSVISPYVIKAIGERAARYYFLTAARFEAAEAHQIGLVHQVVAKEALKSVGVMLANELLKFSPAALTQTKQLTQNVSAQIFSEKLIELTVQHLVDGRNSASGKEGLAAFLEKRAPRWT